MTTLQVEPKRPPRMRGSGVLCRALRASHSAPVEARGHGGRRPSEGPRSALDGETGGATRAGADVAGGRNDRRTPIERADEVGSASTPCYHQSFSRPQPPGRHRVTGSLSAGSGCPVFHVGLARLAVTPRSTRAACGSVLPEHGGCAPATEVYPGTSRAEGCGSRPSTCLPEHIHCGAPLLPS